MSLSEITFFIRTYSTLSNQWCSGKFGTVGTLGSPVPLLSPSLFSASLPFSPFLSPTFPTPPLSGGNDFNDFPENQLKIDFGFL